MVSRTCLHNMRYSETLQALQAPLGSYGAEEEARTDEDRRAEVCGTAKHLCCVGGICVVYQLNFVLAFFLLGWWANRWIDPRCTV